jgi:Flagella basal body rod protein
MTSFRVSKGQGCKRVKTSTGMRPVKPRRFAAELVENLNATGMLIAFGEDCFERAMYKALSGANAQSRRLEVAAQDLPNVNTSRYKGQRLAFSEVLANRLPVSERPGGLVSRRGRSKN